MSQHSLWHCVKIDSFDIKIPFTLSKSEIICFLKEKGILVATPTEKQVIIKSKMFSLDTTFCIDFHFNNERLIGLTMSPDIFLEGKALYCRYGEIQKILEGELGHPHKHSSVIMNLLDPDGRLAQWCNKDIKIEHYLLNRFGMEEIISIVLYNEGEVN